MDGAAPLDGSRRFSVVRLAMSEDGLLDEKAHQDRRVHEAPLDRLLLAEDG